MMTSYDYPHTPTKYISYKVTLKKVEELHNTVTNKSPFSIKIDWRVDQLGNQVDMGENFNSPFSYFRHVLLLVAFRLRNICNNSPQIFNFGPFDC